MSDKGWRLAGPALVAVWAAFALWSHWDRWSVDLSAVWFAGHVFAEGDADAIYTPGHPPDPIPPRWREVGAEAGGVGGTISPYLYPPWVAGAAAPMTRALGMRGFFDLGYLVNVGALALSILLAARLARPGGLSLFAWCAISVGLMVTGFPAQLSLDLNQAQNLVNALTLAAFVLVAARWSATGGAVLAAAAAIKLSPLVFATIFLADRNWRALAGFAAACAGFLAFDLAISPAAYNAAFLAKMHAMEGEVLLSRIDHSLGTALYLLATALQGAPLPDFANYDWVPAPGWLAPMLKLALVGGVSWSLWITRRVAPRPRTWLRLQLIATIAFLTGPLSWTHYLLFQTLLAPAVLGVWPGRPGRLVLASFALALSAPLFLALIGMPEHELVPMFWGLAVTFGWLGLMGLAARSTGQNSPDL